MESMDADEGGENGVAARDFLRSVPFVLGDDAYDASSITTRCARLESDDASAEDRDTVCCRVESTGAGPPVMFVPCALLDAADEPLRACNRAGGVASSFQSIHEDTERGLSRLDRVVAPGASDLARRYRRARALDNGKDAA